MELKKFQRVYVFADVCSALASWFFFNLYWISSVAPVNDSESFLPIVIVLVFWLLLYYSTGYYNNVFRKLRLEDFSQTFLVVFFGSCILFFAFFVKGFIYPNRHYLESFLILFLLQFHLTLIPRLVITSYLIKQEKKGKIRFKAVLIGQVGKIQQVLNDLNNRPYGHRILGYISVHEKEKVHAGIEIERLGEFCDIHNIVKSRQVDDVIIALEENNAEVYRRIIYELNSSNVIVKVNPELYSIVQKQAVISSLFKYPLIEVSRNPLRPWQSSLKQFIDIMGAIVGLIITLPVSVFLVIAIKVTSDGPVFYTHERTGRFGKPFRILKFRSMYNNAETNGPQLSSKSDCRITPVGRFMRRFKLDEIPNFVNVLKGEMSLVGPRPERKYYIEQIVQRAPDYTRLFKIKPGVTSWGQVKYGYAENVDEMVRRMRYDLLYIDNMSLYVDFQILARTFLIILRGRAREK